MTHDEIDRMSLDELQGAIVKLQFPAIVNATPELLAAMPPMSPYPNYARDIAAAWELVTKLLAIAPQVDVSCWGDNTYHCFVHGYAAEYWELGKVGEDEQAWAEGDTAPEAICRAYLKAVSTDE